MSSPFPYIALFILGETYLIISIWAGSGCSGIVWSRYGFDLLFFKQLHH
jgi:hypothetical protein